MSASADPVDDFAARLAASLEEKRFVRAVFAKYRGGEPDLERIDLRVVPVCDTPQLQFVYRHTTRDVARNHPFSEASGIVRTLLGPSGFRHAQLYSNDALDELAIIRRGQAYRRQQLHGRHCSDSLHPLGSP